MAIDKSSGVQNGVTGWFSLSGSTVTVTVSSTDLFWRVNGTKSAGDHHSQTGKFYINENRNSSGKFVAEDNHMYAFQVCKNNVWSNGAFFTVTFGSEGSSGGENDVIGGGDGTDWGFSAKDIYWGDNCAITWYPASSDATYKIEFSFGGYSTKTDPFVTGKTAPESYTFANYIIPVSAATHIPNEASTVVRARVIRYSDSSCTTEVGSGIAHFTMTLKDDVVPTITSCEAILDNSDNQILDSWGVALAKRSRVRLRANASGIYGSRILSYTITGDYNAAVTANSLSGELDYIGPAIVSSGNKAFTITCMDSRGRISSQKITNSILFFPYSDPKINKLSVTKEAYGDSDPANDRMVVTAEWSHDPIDGYNHSFGQIYYKTTTASDWTLHDGVLSSGYRFVLTNLSLKEYTSYNFKLVITDGIGNTASMESFSSTTPVLLDFKAGGDGLGIGKVCEEPGMEVSMDTTFFRQIYIGNKNRTLEDYIKSLSPTFDMIYPVGSIYISVIGTDPGLLFGGSWEQLPGRFLLGAGSNDENTTNAYGDIDIGELNRTAGEKGGEISHKLTINEMPEHTHSMNSPAVDVRMQGGSGDFWPIQYSPNSSNGVLIRASGGNNAHNNIPPYLAVYMWKRVA